MANSTSGARSLRPETPIRVASVVSALSHALDLSTGQPVGHSIRSCIIGMRIAEEIGLGNEVRDDLFYALLLKDCGCSGNASKTFHALRSDDLKAKFDVKTKDWTSTNWESFQYALSHVAPGKPFLERAKALFLVAATQKAHAKDVTKIRCERGATLARLMGLSEATAIGILNLDEHWNGGGYPLGLRRTEIPLSSRIMLLAQTLEVFVASTGARSAVDVANARRKTWFDPDLVKAVNSLAKRGTVWAEAQAENPNETCLRLESQPRTMTNSDTSLDNICMAFANIIDAKSPYTLNHSMGVANATVATARMLGCRERELCFFGIARFFTTLES